MIVPIKIDGNRYYVFDYEKELDYENINDKGSDVIEPALIHYDELIIEDAKKFKKWHCNWITHPNRMRFSVAMGF